MILYGEPYESGRLAGDTQRLLAMLGEVRMREADRRQAGRDALGAGLAAGLNRGVGSLTDALNTVTLEKWRSAEGDRRFDRQQDAERTAARDRYVIPFGFESYDAAQGEAASAGVPLNELLAGRGAASQSILDAARTRSEADRIQTLGPLRYRMEAEGEQYREAATPFIVPPDLAAGVAEMDEPRRIEFNKLMADDAEAVKKLAEGEYEPHEALFVRGDIRQRLYPYMMELQERQAKRVTPSQRFQQEAVPVPQQGLVWTRDPKGGWQSHRMYPPESVVDTQGVAQRLAAAQADIVQNLPPQQQEAAWRYAAQKVNEEELETRTFTMPGDTSGLRYSWGKDGIPKPVNLETFRLRAEAAEQREKLRADIIKSLAGQTVYEERDGKSSQRFLTETEMKERVSAVMKALEPAAAKDEPASPPPAPLRDNMQQDGQNPTVMQPQLPPRALAVQTVQTLQSAVAGGRQLSPQEIAQLYEALRVLREQPQ